MSVSLNSQSNSSFTKENFKFNGFDILDINFLNTSYGTNFGLVKKMFQAFLDSNISEVPKLKKSIEDLDYKTIKFVAHKIKNNFYYVGLGSVSKLLAEMEKKAVLESEDVFTLFQKFIGQYELTMEVIEKEKDRLSKYLSK